MKFHTLKSFMLLLLSVMIFTACANKKTNGGDTPSTPPIPSCTMTGTAIKCTNILVDDDVDFINTHKATITSLDLTATPNMITQKQLENITSTDFPLLDNLSISKNQSLTSLNLAKFPTLTKLSAIYINNITGFNDIKKNLTTIEVSIESGIPLTDITNLTDKTKVTTLALYLYTDTSLDISEFTNLTELTLTNLSGLTGLDLSALTNLTTLKVDGLNQLTTLTLPTKLTNLTKLTLINLSGLTGLDISKFTNLTKLQVYDLAKLTTLDLSALTNLTYLYVSWLGSVSTLDLAKLTNLTNLTVWGLGITTLDLSALTNLTNLRVRDLGIQTLDISALKKLTTLNVYDLAKLTTLTLPTNAPNLTSLNLVHLAVLQKLDLSKLTNLTYLDLWNLGIATLDLSKFTASLTTLDLNMNTALNQLNLGTKPFVNKLTVTGFGNSALDSINTITHPTSKIKITLKSPDINYPPKP